MDYNKFSADDDITVLNAKIAARPELDSIEKVMKAYADEVGDDEIFMSVNQLEDGSIVFKY